MVGDDDQAIYQWRGSDVQNIVEFGKRYPGVEKFEISTNRRSLPSIVTAAAGFAQSIPGRLDKDMRPFRESAGTEIVTWSAETEADECELIAETIQRLHAEGLPYRDIAVLVRGKVAYPALLQAFDHHGVPVQPGGRTGLFTRPEAKLSYANLAHLLGERRESGEPYDPLDMSRHKENHSRAEGDTEAQRPFFWSHVGLRVRALNVRTVRRD